MELSDTVPAPVLSLSLCSVSLSHGAPVCHQGPGLPPKLGHTEAEHKKLKNINVTLHSPTGAKPRDLNTREPLYLLLLPGSGAPADGYTHRDRQRDSGWRDQGAQQEEGLTFLQRPTEIMPETERPGAAEVTESRVSARGGAAIMHVRGLVMSTSQSSKAMTRPYQRCLRELDPDAAETELSCPGCGVCGKKRDSSRPLVNLSLHRHGDRTAERERERVKKKGMREKERGVRDKERERDERWRERGERDRMR
ncbi:hypothetical protein WMY93_031495 [Mugilogobius chulae]|uniref:Uncharacterized protein n=1 Tax=Mugilogobius chulae TaxID=88201 RepID=A0AAW0MFJ2_9GOBI